MLKREWTINEFYWYQFISKSYIDKKLKNMAVGGIGEWAAKTNTARDEDF